MFTKVRNEKGFTLIELLIVVAIIGILAAIAIPQFAAYRIRGYNSAAQADLRNIATAEEAFFADWQVYASSDPAGVPGGGALLLGPQAVTIPVLAATISTVQPTADTTFKFNLSSGVNIDVATDTTVGGEGATYTGVTKHTNGDTYFGVDSMPTGLYRSTGAATACASVAGDTPAATSDAGATPPASDFAGITPAGCLGASAWAAQ